MTAPAADVQVYDKQAHGAVVAEAVRAGGVQSAVVYARRDGVDIVQGSLRILDGGVTDKPGTGGVRRNLDLEVEDATGELFDALTPAGTTLHPYSVIRLTDNTEIHIPQGVFDVDVERAGIGPSGGLRLTSPDLYARVQRARFLRPQQSFYGLIATQQITELLRGALGFATPVLNYSSSLARIGNAVWEEKRDEAIEECAKAAGVWVGFDRLGRCCIVDLPELGSPATWVVDASASGVLLGGDRERSRRGTANVVRVSGEKADAYGPAFDPVVVWDPDPASPTYAGPDPQNRPDLAGPFGVVPYLYSSPLLMEAHDAEVAARAILARTTGMAASLTVTAVRNPTLDAFDTIEVRPPRRTPDSPLTAERHVVDAVTHPLTPGGVQQITGRSTRTDEFTNQ